MQEELVDGFRERFEVRTATDADPYECEFFNSLAMRHPDLIICPTILDAGSKDWKGMPHVFRTTHRRNWAGCYLMYTGYVASNPCCLLPLYVGKTDKFDRRLSEHWLYRTDVVDKFFDDMADDKLLRTDLSPADVRYRSDLAPSGVLWIAMWKEDDDRERMFLEHELIFKTSPLYNKG